MDKNEKLMQWIDNASLYDLLKLNRFGESGDPMFLGKVGEHFIKILAKRREEAGPAEWTRTSKLIGWGRG